MKVSSPEREEKKTVQAHNKLLTAVALINNQRTDSIR